MKAQIMWLSVTACMIVLVGFWVWSLSGLGQGTSGLQAQDKGLQDLGQLKEEIPSLWQSLSSGLGSVLDSAKELINNQASSTPAVPQESQLPAQKLPME